MAHGRIGQGGLSHVLEKEDFAYGVLARFPNLKWHRRNLRQCYRAAIPGSKKEANNCPYPTRVEVFPALLCCSYLVVDWGQSRFRSHYFSSAFPYEQE